MSRLAPGSIWTKEDQLRWYRESMGAEKTAEQVRLARLRDHKCVCEPRLLKRKWDGDRLTIRSVHDVGCPKWKTWMNDV